MCGIVGIVNFNKEQPVDRKILQEKTELLYHRGPDDGGIYIDRNVGLGFRRLSIIDLSTKGHQPMCNEDDSLWLVFNGEIYNYLELRRQLRAGGHRFKSNSDAEVILHAYEVYGYDCVKKFNGMWAFALWDKNKDLLFCSRDRFGIKPFYYFQGNGQFVFASEIKTLLAFPNIPKQENPKQVFEYLVHGHIDRSEETMFKGIFQLRGGYNLILKKRRISIARYWDLSDTPNDYDLTGNGIEGIHREFRNLLYDCLKLHLRSDVEIWTLLSGGLDSSAIVCLQREMKRNNQIHSLIKTISVIYNKKELNEYEYVKELIDNEHIVNVAVFPDGNTMVDTLEKVVFLQDEPFPQMTPFNHYFLMQELSKRKIKVVLSGEGSDECFCGYLPTLSTYLFMDLLKNFQLCKLASEMYAYIQIQKHSLHFHSLLSLILQMFKSLVNKKIASLVKAKYIDKSLELIRTEYTHLEKETFIFECFKRHYSTLNNHLYRMLLSDSLPRILHMEDRNSMAFSIEQRVPFLDYRLVEFAFSLSNAQKVNQGISKWILREGLRNILPEKIRMRITKLSFNPPEERWMKSDALWRYLQDINYRRFVTNGMINSDVFEQVFVNFRKNKCCYRSIFWRIINYLVWKKVYGIA